MQGMRRCHGGKRGPGVPRPLLRPEAFTHAHTVGPPGQRTASLYLTGSAVRPHMRLGGTGTRTRPHTQVSAGQRAARRTHRVGVVEDDDEAGNEEGKDGLHGAGDARGQTANCEIMRLWPVHGRDA